MADNPFAQFAPEASAAPVASGENPFARFDTTQPAVQSKKSFGLADTWPARLAKSVYSAVTLPGDVYTGATPVVGPDGHTSQEVINRSAELAGIATPINPGIRAGDQIVPGAAKTLVPERVPVPSTKELAEAGGRDINAARNSGLELNSSAISDWSRKTQQELFESGIHPVDAPNTYIKLRELESPPPGAFTTASNLQSLREALGATAQNFNPQAAKDQLAASRSIRGLDELLPNVDPKDVLAGAPAATAEQFARGRGNYAAAMRSNDITGNLDRANTGILERAEVRAQAANSGRNLDNTIRQKVASVLEKPKEVSGLTDEEIAVLNAVIEGKMGRNVARYIGNAFGGGGGLGQLLTGGIGAGAGAAVGGVPGALIGSGVPMAVGAGAKSVANALARRSLNQADEALRMRSPLYQERAAKAPMIVQGEANRDFIARLLGGSLMQGD